MRYLDIGPGSSKLEGFETLDFEKRDNVDYVADASGPLPFEDNAFDLIHASHVLEHIHWGLTKQSLVEWVRILKPDGWLEIWVPDGMKAMYAYFHAINRNKKILTKLCGRKNMCKIVRNPEHFLFGVLYSWIGVEGYKNSGHQAMFGELYLMDMFRSVSLVNVSKMAASEAMVHKSKRPNWINLGVKGQKPK